MKAVLLAAGLATAASVALAAPPSAPLSAAPPASGSVAALADGTLLDTTTNSDGQRITVPTHPQLRVAVFTDPAGWHSAWHMHRYPRYIYVLEGTLTVEMPDGKQSPVHAGHFSAEMIGIWHRGANLGPGPLKFLVIDQTVPGSGPNMIFHATKP
jgi:quercetin dioxygenase-like cupin family protein